MEQIGLEPVSVNLGWISEIAPPVLLAVLLVVGLYVIRSLLLRSISDQSRRYHARKAITYIGYFVIALMVLSSANARFAQFTVVIGAIGAGVAFALQEVIASIAGWVALSFGNFYRPGDRVQLGGITGDVIDIGLLRTTLMDSGAWVGGDQYNGRLVRIANSFVFKEPVFNYSSDFPFLWDEFKLPIRYGSDWKRAHQIILDAVKEQVDSFTAQSQEKWDEMVQHYLIEQARLEPMVTLVANDNWIEFTARYIVNYKQRRSTRDAIMRTILDALEETDGAVQLGSATVELVAMPAVHFEPGTIVQSRDNSSA